jgi:hypothetical protein
MLCWRTADKLALDIYRQDAYVLPRHPRNGVKQMGLDITAYGGLTVVRRSLGDEDEKFIQAQLDNGGFWQPGASLDWAEKTWPGRTVGTVTQLTADAIYYPSEKYTFGAGSYSNYGQFRDWLARLAGFTSVKDYWNKATPAAAFYELVHFADNEGVIGAKAAADLAQDFRDFETKALAEGDECRWFVRMFHTWRRACEIAAENGAIDFH